MSRSGGYKCYNLYCKNCIGKSLCGEPGDTALSCIDRIVLQEYKKAEARAEKAEREGCVKKDLDYYKYQRQHPITRFGFSEKEEQP